MATAKPAREINEYELFTEYRETKDPYLRDELVQNYIYIAEILSRKFVNRGIEYEDIYQIACLGILYAVERFNPKKGVKFATYATPTVLGEIRRYFRDKGNFIKVPRRLYEIFCKAEKIKRNTSPQISTTEIARILNLPDGLLEEARDAGDFSFIQSLEYEAYADGTMSLSNLVGREDDHFMLIENRDFVASCLKDLSKQETEFIRLRYYEEKSQKEISCLWNVSQMYVSRLERKVLGKLKKLYFRD